MPRLSRILAKLVVCTLRSGGDESEADAGGEVSGGAIRRISDEW
jgi:hypothetical protein